MPRAARASQPKSAGGKLPPARALAGAPHGLFLGLGLGSGAVEPVPPAHGLGFPFAKLRPYWEKALTDSGVNGAKAVALATVAPAQPQQAGPGRGHKAEEREQETEDAERPSFSTTSDKVNRAILRSPEPAQDLYKSDLLSQKLAARLGPKNPTPQQAAEVTAAARAAADIVKAAPKPTTEKARRALRRTVDDAVKAALAPAPPPPAPPAFDPRSPVLPCPACAEPRPAQGLAMFLRRGSR